MADNKDRGHHHHHHHHRDSNHLFVRSSSSSRSSNCCSLSLRLNTNSSSNTRAATASAAPPLAAPAAVALPRPSSAGHGGVGDVGAATAFASSKKKLKLILKLPKNPSPPSAVSSPSSDPYGSSPTSQNLPDRDDSPSLPSPKFGAALGSVTSAAAPKKILSSLPISHRSALPFPAAAPALFTASVDSQPATFQSASRAAASSSAVATTTVAAVSSRAPTSPTSDAVSRSEEAGEEETGEKPSKKRKVRAVSDPQLARAVVSAAAVNQGSPVHPERLCSLPQNSSNFLVENLNTKDRGTHTVNGVGSTSMLPNEQYVQPLLSKKVLEAIIDKLQKKDLYGVFSEPVDAEEVPDYYNVIKDPMDFGTMKMKIARGDYVSIQLFQKDIFLICGNAMRYNARDTIYYKQARSILDTARKILEVLRTTGSFVDRDQKASVKQKASGSSIKKSSKKAPVGKYLFETTSSDYVSGATLASGCESGAWLFERGKGGKGLMPDKSANGGFYLEVQATKRLSSSPGEVTVRVDQQDNLMGSLFKSFGLKDGRKPIYDENRRNTYRSHSLLFHEKAQVLAGLHGEQLQLLPSGQVPEHAYARSLARFAADLGPVVWKIAAQKIRKALPPGSLFGPGWVGEHEVPVVATSQSNKEQSQILHQRDSRTANTTEMQRSDVHRTVAPVASQSVLLSHSSELQMSSVSQDTSGIVTSASLHRAMCQPTEDLVATANSSMPATGYAGSSQDSLTAMHHNQLSATEPIKLSLTGATFASDVSQLKLLEMVSQNNRLVQWPSGKQFDGTSQPHLCAADQKRGDRGLKVCGHNPIIKSSSSTAAEDSGVSKHTVGGQKSNAIWVPPSSTSQDACFQNSTLLSSESERQHMVQSPLKQDPNAYLTSMCEPTSEIVSTMTSVGVVAGRDDRCIQSWGCPEHMDRNHLGNNTRINFPSQAHVNNLQNHMGGALPQQRVAAQQYDNQRLPFTIPQFLQHQIPSDTPLFIQKPPVQFHVQNSAKAPSLIHLGLPGNCDLQDTSTLNLHSKFSAPMVAAVPPSFNQPWGLVSLQYPLQHAYLSHSLPPDLNACAQTPKSSFEPPINGLADSQQPDLALQL